MCGIDHRSIRALGRTPNLGEPGLPQTLALCYTTGFLLALDQQGTTVKSCDGHWYTNIGLCSLVMKVCGSLSVSVFPCNDPWRP